ncbi:MAG: radical SAM protein, partial [Patescibacteria group bacterium]
MKRITEMPAENNYQNENSIKDIVLAVTYRCNGRCKFCNIWKEKGVSLLPAASYKNLPRNARNINITGGEPFLREDIVEVVRVIVRQCPEAKIIISTNGFSPSLIKKRLQEILRLKRDIGLAVSLDGFGRVHEELRGFPGGFSLALETIRLSRELGIKDVKIAFTLTDSNFKQLKKIYRFSKEMRTEF